MELEIRAVQLDLARQQESITFIKQFCEFIAGNGYNTLVLYLEGRIRTKSFPYPQERESYSLDEMQGVVEYAMSQGIEIIPVVSTLGHAEQFLQYQKIEHLAELRDSTGGRFFNNQAKHIFCPSLSETYAFLETYLTEVSAVFPSKYFHVGCDESWDIGYCELCRQRIAVGETQSGIFAAHMVASHEIVTGKLGKRMLMWDDMFEQYPEALDMIPKDIVLCTWNYDIEPDLPVGHFNNGRRLDPFAQYDRRGFDYIFSTACSIPNIELFTRYAQRYKPLGGLVTIWELKNLFMYRNLPAIAFAGRWWESGKQGNFSDIVNTIFNINDQAFVNAIKTLSSGTELRGRRICDRRMENAEYGYDNAATVLAVMLLDLLDRYIGKIDSEIGKNVFEDIYTTLEQVVIQNELELFTSEMSQDLVSNEIATNKLEILSQRVEKLSEKSVAQWERWRAGITPCHIKEHFDQILNVIRDIPQNDIDDGFLQVYLFLPDIYGSPACSFSVKFNDCDHFEELATGSYKSSYPQGPFYSKRIILPHDRIPESIKVEVWGYGGQGITYLTLKNKTGHYIPSSISSVSGEISHPEYIMDYDRKWSYFGYQDIQQAVVNPDLANTTHSLIAELPRSPSIPADSSTI